MVRVKPMPVMKGVLLLFVLCLAHLCAGDAGEKPSVSALVAIYGHGEHLMHASSCLERLLPALAEYCEQEGRKAEIVVYAVGTAEEWNYRKQETTLGLVRGARGIYDSPWIEKVEFIDINEGLRRAGGLQVVTVAAGMAIAAEAARGDTLLFLAGHLLVEEHAVTNLLASLSPDPLGASAALIADLEAALVGESEKLMASRMATIDEAITAKEQRLAEEAAARAAWREEAELKRAEEDGGADTDTEPDVAAEKDIYAHGYPGMAGDEREEESEDDREAREAEEAARALQQLVDNALPSGPWFMAAAAAGRAERLGAGMVCGRVTSTWDSVLDAGMEFFMEKAQECRVKNRWSAKNMMVNRGCQDLPAATFRLQGGDEEQERRRGLMYAMTQSWEYLPPVGVEWQLAETWMEEVAVHSALPFARWEGEHVNDRRTRQSGPVDACSGLFFAIRADLYHYVGGIDGAYVLHEPAVRHSILAVAELGQLVAGLGHSTRYEASSSAVGMTALAPELLKSVPDEVSDSRLFSKRWSRVIQPLVSERHLTDLPVVWDMECGSGAVLGFTVEAVSIVTQLERLLPIAVNVANKHECFKEMKAHELPAHVLRSLNRLVYMVPQALLSAKEEDDIEVVAVIHRDPGRYESFIDKLAVTPMYTIGRSMYETDTIPGKDWVEKCDVHVDEVWVPTAFNAETFAESGVAASKLAVVPEPIDVHAYDADAPTASRSLDLHGGQETRFTFLTIMKWEVRKAWRELIQAYVTEFLGQKDVQLLLRCSLEEADQEELDALMAELIEEYGDEEVPAVLVLEEKIPFWLMPALYKEADVFVLASHGEGWGLPLMQAMSMGLPTIGTAWSGNTAFMTAENSLLVDVESLVEVEEREGHRWAQPCGISLQQRLREAYSMSSEEREELGRKARATAEEYAGEKVARSIVDRIRDIDENREQRKAASEERMERKRAAQEEERKRHEAEQKEKQEEKAYEAKLRRSKYTTWVPKVQQEVEVDGSTFYKMRVVDHKPPAS